MGKRIVIATGGTGGHIFPALGLAAELKNHEVIFAGGGLDKNRFFDPHRYPYHTIQSSTLSFKKAFSSLQTIYRGTKESISLLNKLKPDLLVGFGSFHTLPLLAAARLTNTPFILHEANAYPGKVNRLMAPLSRMTAIQFQESAKYLRGKTQLCPLPLREEFHKGPIEKERARMTLDLDPCKTTLLIFGGSQGAQEINRICSKEVVKLDVQVIHLTGANDNTSLIEHYKKHAIKAVVLPYSSQMPLLWSASDLCITRSGASTIAEMIAFGTPALLIPYPHATNNHQEKNGAIISKKIGGAVMLRESELPGDLLRVLKHLLGNEKEVCHAMRSALLLAKKKQGRSLFELIEEELVQ